MVLGPITPAELLRRNAPAGEPSLLSSARSYICGRSSDEGTSFAMLIDEPLNYRRLMDVLYAVAPYKAHGPDRFSRVLDNWALVERARTSEGSEKLMLEHANALKLSWQEFERHRERFVAVLRDQTGSTRMWPLISWFVARDGRRRWVFSDPADNILEALVGSCPDVPLEQLDTLVGLVTIPYLLPELTSGWPAWQPLKKGGKSNYIGPASVPVMSLMHRRALLHSPLIQSAEPVVASREETRNLLSIE